MFKLLINSDGSIGFSETPTCSNVPINDDQLTNKLYVDSKGSFIETITLDGDTSVLVSKLIN